MLLPARGTLSPNFELASNSHKREAGGEGQSRDPFIGHLSRVHFIAASAPKVYMTSNSVN